HRVRPWPHRWTRFHLDLQTHINLLAPRSPRQGAQECANLDVRLRCRRTEAPQHRYWKHDPRPRKVSGADLRCEGLEQTRYV
ncbi:unnamed protein product, partial [Alternaria alternata]